MTEVATCPDCRRPVAQHYWQDDDEFCFATGSVTTCMPQTIARLRAALAPGGELEAHNAEAAHLLFGYLEDKGLPKTRCMRWYRAEQALRAKAGR